MKRLLDKISEMELLLKLAVSLCLVTSIAAQCHHSIDVTIVEDEYPRESSWELVDDLTDEVILSSDGTESLGIDDQCDGWYTFKMFDSYGDGLCCEFGQGSYSLSVDSITFVTVTNFTGDEHRTEFYIEEGEAVFVNFTGDWSTPTDLTWLGNVLIGFVVMIGLCCLSCGFSRYYSLRLKEKQEEEVIRQGMDEHVIDIRASMGMNQIEVEPQYDAVGETGEDGPDAAFSADFVPPPAYDADVPPSYN